MKIKMHKVLYFTILLTIVFLGGKIVTAYATENNTIIDEVESHLDDRNNSTLVEGAMPCKGNVRILVVNIISEDVSNELTKEDLEKLLFGNYCSYGSNVVDENLHDYIQSVSNNHLFVNGDVENYTIDDSSLEYIEEKQYEILNAVLKNKNISDYDSNSDDYIDAVYFLLPDNISSENGGFVKAIDYQLNDKKLCSLVYLTKQYKNVATFAHEMVHLMGIPDMYANVSVNKSGNFADALMCDGLTSSWNNENGSTTVNMPGIIKLFFGWLDNVQQIYFDGEYKLGSFSLYNDGIIVYPKQNKKSKFIFFVEYLTADGNDKMLADYEYFNKNGKSGGLRVWKILLNVNDNGEIIGNSIQKGCGNSPFKYIEAVNCEGKMLLHEGDQWSSDTTPNSFYFTDVKYDKYFSDYFKTSFDAALPVEEFDSGIVIDNIRLNEKYINIKISFSIKHKYSENTTFLVNQDGTHSWFCDECGNEITEKHNYIYEYIDEEQHLQKCSVCGDKQKLKHEWNIDSIEKATCENNGTIDLRCKECNKKKTEIIIASGHTVVVDDAVAPTCTKTGLTEGSHCSVCNEVLQAQEEIPALGHIWNDGEVTTAPTCTEVGVKTFTCETCGETRTEEVKATGHTVVDDEAVAPTCTKTGLTAGSHCSVCNEVLKAQEEIAALGHTWNNGEVTTAATCIETGVKTFTCETCGDTRTEEVEATGHTVVVDNVVEPTCTKSGLTAGSHCSVCNEVLTAQEEISALGHTWNEGEITTAPTCTESGIKTFTCETCGETRTEEIKATGHTVVVDNAVEPTCTKPGHTVGSHCSVCNEVLKAQEEIPALGHTWDDGEVTTAPTCTEIGVKTFTCETCGDTRTEEIKATGHTAVDDEAVAPTCTKPGLTAGSHCSVCNEVFTAQEEISAIGHIWNDGEITTAPTCTETGVKTFTCETCGETRTEEIKATGHTVVVDNAVDPTCTKPGLTEGSHCSVCNEVLQAQEEVPALGHTWNTGTITQQPTYTAKGIRTYTCTVCKETKKEYIPALKRTDITKTSSKVKITGIENKIYNGKAQTQTALVITANGKKLKNGIDYTVTYKNNKNIGTATFAITGKNAYTGTIKKTFAIKTAVGKVYTGTYKYKITSAKTNGTGTVSIIGSAYAKTNKKFATLKVADTVTIGGVKFKITRIETKAFMGYQYLKNVVIGSNVTSIGDYAFYKCPRLETVTVGKNVKTIGTKVFYGCKNFRAMKILSSKLTKVGTSTFAGIKANATFALPKKYYNSYSKVIKKAGAPKKAVYKKF